MDTLKRSLTMNEYLDDLLEQRMLIENALKEHVKEKTNFTGDESLLNLEARIFSFWVISLIVKDKEFKEMFHQRFCNAIGLDRIQTQLFYVQIRSRHDNYDYSYSYSIGNHHKGYFLASVMSEIIVNQNSDFSIQKTRPMTDFNIDLGMFNFFSFWFNNIRDFTDKLKENYILPSLN